MAFARRGARGVTRKSFVYPIGSQSSSMAGADAVQGWPELPSSSTPCFSASWWTLYALCGGEGGILAGLLATVAGWISAGGSLARGPRFSGWCAWPCRRPPGSQRRDGRIRWWLIPQTWLWASVHGTWLYAVGLAVLPVWACCWPGKWPEGLLFGWRVLSGNLGRCDAHAGGPQLPSLLAISRISPFMNCGSPRRSPSPHAAALLMGLASWSRGSAAGSV